MLSDPAAERARRRIVGLAASGLDAPALLAAVAGEVQAVVDYDGAVWATVDPETVVITSAVVEELPRDSAAAFYENEYGHDDVIAFARLARGLRPVATASEATGGDLARSRLHREVGSAFGFLGDQLRAAFTVGGSCWGVVALGRRRPLPHFRQADVSFLASIAGPIAEGLRRAVLIDALEPSASPGGAPALVLVDAAGAVTAASPAARGWLEELSLDDGLAADRRAPAALRALAARARDARPDAAAPARARVRTPSGRWLLLHGCALEGEGAGGAAAVVIEPARAPDVTPLIVEAFGLSAREREVARLVVLGASTADVARALVISPYTVQDHLKAIFDKVGVRSRGDLARRVLSAAGAPG
jgi:DNA-binding CsgD family transcriptional regulator